MSVAEINKAYDALQKAERDLETLRDVYARAVNRYITTSAADFTKRILTLENENAELRKRAGQIEEGMHPFPNGFIAKITASTTEKAYKNVLYYNPGRPFEGDVFVKPLPSLPTLYKNPENSVMRLVYDSTIPVRCVATGLYECLSFNLTMNLTATFLPAQRPVPIERCTLRISQFNHSERILQDHANWRPLLDGMVCVDGCPLAIKDSLDFDYRVVPTSMEPLGAGIFTKETRFLIETDSDVQ